MPRPHSIATLADLSDAIRRFRPRRRKLGKRRIQPGVRGQPRKQVSTRIARAIEDAIKREQWQYPGVSRSFIIATRLAQAFNLPLDNAEDYRR